MTYIVAEISASHNGTLSNALQLVAEAANAGADAIKLQTFEPEELVANQEYVIQAGPWAGGNLLELYRKAHTPKEWHKPIFELAEKLGIEAFSTPFQPSDVDFLESIGCPKYKIASFEIVHLPLIRRAAETGKPLIISTGMAREFEIMDAVTEAEWHGAKNITLLHCVSEYPANPDDTNLATMTDLGKYGHKVGLSDHSLGYAVPVVAAALGASVIEKHIGLDRSGPDGEFLMLPEDFAEMVGRVRQVKKILGYPTYGKETSSTPLRPSLHYAESLPAGTLLQSHHFRIARPATGLHPIWLKTLVNTKLSESVKAGDPVEQGI